MDVENLAKELILKNMTPEQQMAVLDSIKESVAKAKEVQKRKIGENVDLVVQALKKIEEDIRSRYDDIGNAIEKRVASIKDGRDGIDGRDGKDGKDGKQGKEGRPGRDGKDGKDGLNGVDGQDGVSVVNAHIDFDGSLVIHLSSGKEINVGEVVAQDLAEKIKVITNGGGTSQVVLDTLASLQTQIDDLIPSQSGQSGKFLTTNGSVLSWSSVAGGLSYQGTWNASTNTPTLASGVGTNGYYYIVSTAGSTNLDGITDWQIGDWLMFNGTIWQKIDQSNLVTSVNGQTGAVSLTTTNINEGTNLYYLDSRARQSLSAGTGISYSTSTGVITNSSPDQTVSLTGAGTTSISGTYPSFTITSNDQYQGTVTSVTGTSPIVSSGGNTPAISIPQATSSVNGYLSSTDWSTFNNKGNGTVTSVAQSFTGGLISVSGSPITSSGTLALTVAGTSGGIPYFSSASTWASSGVLTANGLVIGNGAGAAPSTTTTGTGVLTAIGNAVNTASGLVTQSGTLTNSSLLIGNGSSAGISSTTTGTGVVTALGVNTGSSGAFVVNGGALGTPSSGTVTNLTGTASININGTVGATTPSTGAFTTLSASGVATFSAGSAAAPAITTSGDTNNGIFFPAADVTAITTAGSERLRIDSSGNVGIGTSSPSVKLEVNRGSAGSIATFTDGVSTNFNFSTSGTVGTFGTDAGSTSLALKTSGTERLRIDSSGNVGIGTTSPSSKLEVYDATSAVARVTAGTEIFEIRNTGSEVRLAVVSADPMTFRTSNVEAMRIDSSGNVGIGTSSPSTYGKFAVQTQTSNAPTVAITGSGLNPQLNHYINDSTAVLRNLNQIQFVTGSSDISNYQGYMTFSTMGSAGGTISERMRIDASGNLRVGTTSGNADARTTIAQGSTDSSPCIDYQKGSATTTTAQVYARFFCNGGSTATGSITANGVSAATFTAYSDRRLKENIVDLPSQLNNIMSLRPVEFDYKGYSSGDGHQIGFIAQEVQSVYPDLVAEGDNGMLTLSDMNKNDARLIKAIQELKAIVDAQAARIAALEAQ